jgi:hypothetical protein
MGAAIFFLPVMYKSFKTNFTNHLRALRIEKYVVSRWFLFLELMFDRFLLFSLCIILIEGVGRCLALCPTTGTKLKWHLIKTPPFQRICFFKIISFKHFKS